MEWGCAHPIAVLVQKGSPLALEAAVLNHALGLCGVPVEVLEAFLPDAGWSTQPNHNPVG